MQRLNVPRARSLDHFLDNPAIVGGDQDQLGVVGSIREHGDLVPFRVEDRLLVHVGAVLGGIGKLSSNVLDFIPRGDLRPVTPFHFLGKDGY